MPQARGADVTRMRCKALVHDGRPHIFAALAPLLANESLDAKIVRDGSIQEQLTDCGLLLLGDVPAVASANAQRAAALRAIPVVYLQKADQLASPTHHAKLCVEGGCLDGETLREAIAEARRLTRAPPVPSAPLHAIARGVLRFDEHRTRPAPGIDEYRHACASLGLVPSTRFLSCANEPAVMFRQANLSSLGVGPIAEWLGANRTCTTLDLSHNCIGPTGVEALVSALESNRTCSTLVVSANGVADPTGAAPPRLLALLRGGHCSLTALDLANNRLRDRGCEAVVRAVADGGLAKTSLARLTTLRLGGNQAGPLCARALGNYLRSAECCLTSLNLAWSELRASAVDLLSALETNCSVRAPFSQLCRRFV